MAFTANNVSRVQVVVWLASETGGIKFPGEGKIYHQIGYCSPFDVKNTCIESQHYNGFCLVGDNESQCQQNRFFTSTILVRPDWLVIIHQSGIWKSFSPASESFHYHNTASLGKQVANFSTPKMSTYSFGHGWASPTSKRSSVKVLTTLEYSTSFSH